MNQPHEHDLPPPHFSLPTHPCRPRVCRPFSSLSPPLPRDGERVRAPRGLLELRDELGFLYPWGEAKDGGSESQCCHAPLLTIRGQRPLVDVTCTDTALLAATLGGPIQSGTFMVLSLLARRRGCGRGRASVRALSSLWGAYLGVSRKGTEKWEGGAFDFHELKGK